MTGTSPSRHGEGWQETSVVGLAAFPGQARWNEVLPGNASGQQREAEGCRREECGVLGQRRILAHGDLGAGVVVLRRWSYPPVGKCLSNGACPPLKSCCLSIFLI